MRLVCKQDQYYTTCGRTYKFFTKGKFYYISDKCYNIRFRVVNDLGNLDWIDANKFESFDKYLNRQILTLLEIETNE